MSRIHLKWSQGEAFAQLDDTPTARALIEALPFSGRANTWGEEVYFSAPIEVKLEANARQVVDPGTVCFWVEGSSLALPYGPTPVSKSDECRLVTKVNTLGKLEGAPRVLASVRSGERIDVTRAD
jgi:uncharacterized protein